jgi:cysteine-rich repeat protein
MKYPKKIQLLLLTAIIAGGFMFLISDSSQQALAYPNCDCPPGCPPYCPPCCPPPEPNGSITVCKIIIDSERNIVDGSEISGITFTVPGITPDPETSQGAPIGQIPDSVFTTPLTLNADLIGDDQINDAQCITYDGLSLGGYYYGEEEIVPEEGWEEPLYNDQNQTPIEDLDDFFNYSGELFDENPANDSERNTDADGHIALTQNRPERTLVVLNQYQEIEEEVTTILAYKVVCESEEDLPNWGDGSGPLIIDENTAGNYVEESQDKCWLEEDWDFQWGFQDKSGTEGVDKLPGPHIGQADGTESSCASNCGTNTNTGTGYNDWKDFDSSTGTSTPAMVVIGELEDAPGIWVRENLKQGYFPFTYPPYGGTENNVSAEIYCHEDVYKYDNYDLIGSPELGGTYYCIAFNALISESEPECGNGILEDGEECDDGNNVDGDGCSANCQIEVCNPEEELVINGGFEEPVVSHNKKWNIFNSSEVPGWTVEWNTSEPSYGGMDRPADAHLELHRGVNNWLPYEEFQYAELDTDWDGPDGSVSGEPASTKIYQDIPTIPGATYSIIFYFSPRPSTDEDNNQLEFSWDGDIKDTISAVGSSNTNWTEYAYSFTATCNTTRLQFTDLGTSDSLGTFLDSVSVRCQPPQEPVCGNGIKEGDEQCEYDEDCDEGMICSDCMCVEEPEEPGEPVTILAYKVVCDTEADLPNWGTDGAEKPLYINSNTAQGYVSGSSGKCSLVEGWDFQWGLNGQAQKQDGDHIGPAPDGTGWNNFDSSTGTSTPAQVQIADLENTSKIWVRENLQGGYIPFANPPGALQDNVSAEMYCYDDILNYDNYDYIQNPQYGITYYCIAFNAPVPGSQPYCGNGEKELDEECDDGNNVNGDGCSANCEIEEGPEPGCVDADEDGYCAYDEVYCLEGNDCDDSDPDVNPGADEICDGFDNDCDGETDEDLVQQCGSSDVGVCQFGNQTCEAGVWGECVGAIEPVAEICDDGLDNDCDGLVDGNDPNCQEVVSGGGGGVFFFGLRIFNETASIIGTSTAIINWQTNLSATSRVIYDTLDHSVLGDPPNYGYAYSTIEDSTKVTYHTVTIEGLIPGLAYYYRCVSHTSPEEEIGKEFSFITLGEKIEEEVEEEVILPEEEVVLPEEELPIAPPEGEEVIPEEEVEEEIVVAPEEEEGMGLDRFLAAIGTFLGSANFCWLFFLLIIILTCLYLLSIKRIEKRKQKWIYPLGILALIVFYCVYCCANCWLLVLSVSIIIILFFLFRKKIYKKPPEML